GPSRYMSADRHACDGVPERGAPACPWIRLSPRIRLRLDDEELAVWTENHRRKRSLKSLRHSHAKRTSLHDGSACLTTSQVPQAKFDWFRSCLYSRVFRGLIAQEDSEVRTEKKPRGRRHRLNAPGRRVEPLFLQSRHWSGAGQNDD